MKRLMIACLAALASGVAAAPAAAQIWQDPATGVITCTTSAGFFQRRLVTGVGETGRIVGLVRLVSPNPSPRYTAAGGFVFRETASSENTSVEIALRPGTTDRIVVGLHIPGQPFVELGEYPANLWFPLAISYARGEIRVMVGTRVTHHRVRLNGPLLPALHCNSGTFQFRLGPGLGMGDYLARPADPNAPPAHAPDGGAPSPSGPSR